MYCTCPSLKCVFFTNLLPLHPNPVFIFVGGLVKNAKKGVKVTKKAKICVCPFWTPPPLKVEGYQIGIYHFKPFSVIILIGVKKKVFDDFSKFGQLCF